MSTRIASNIFLIVISSAGMFAQDVVRTNPLVENIVKEISADSIKVRVEKLESFGTRHTLSDTTDQSHGIGAARRWITSEFKRFAGTSRNQMTVEEQQSIAPASVRLPHPTSIVNIVATFRPAIPSSRFFIVSSHYDSRCTNVADSVSAAPGADDNASGTALVLELARVFSKYSFNANIMFITFAAEEQGLIGSTQFAEMAKQQSQNIEGVLNNDIVGSIHGGGGEVESSYVRVFSEAYSLHDSGATIRSRNALGLENDGPSRSLARYVKEIGERYVSNFEVRMIYRRDRYLRGGDHTPFHERGFAAVRFTEAKENFDHQHQNVRVENGKEFGDLSKFMNFNYCANVARINASALASLALAPSSPSEARIITRQLDYDTELTWNKNTDRGVTRYVIRYRETTSPTWQHAIATSDTSIVLHISKDDYIFGIQAIDSVGDASLVAIPQPQR